MRYENSSEYSMCILPQRRMPDPGLNHGHNDRITMFRRSDAVLSFTSVISQALFERERYHRYNGMGLASCGTRTLYHCLLLSRLR